MKLPNLDDDNINLPPLEEKVGLPNIEDFSLPNEFEQVDVQEVDNENDEYNNEIYQDIKENTPQTIPNLNTEEEEDIYYKNDYNPDYEKDIKRQENQYIDEQNKQIIPLGGNRSKINVTSSDFDNRKNILSTTKIVRFVIMLGLLFTFLLGLKNTFMPSHVYTDTQIKNFAREGAGQTDFPRERGIAFVEDFMTAYLTIDKSKPELNDILSYYYGENTAATLSQSQTNIKISNDVKQNVVIGPTIYEVNLLTDYSALFKVSSYVSDINGSVGDGKGATGRWLSFAVNVYYDIKQDTLAITPDSPIVIPPYQIAKQTQVPERAPFGNGQINNEIGPAINPTINGFVEAYAKSSVASHESILQYISDKNDISLYDGFGGTLKLAGSPETAIKRTIYNNNDGVYRVILAIDWIDVIASDGDSQVGYTGRYIMRVKPEGGGKYTVSSFVPYTYYK